MPSARPHAPAGYFGLRFLRDGAWGERQIVPRQLIEAARTSTESQVTYGYMNWFLSTPRVGRDGEESRPWPAAPEPAASD